MRHLYVRITKACIIGFICSFAFLLGSNIYFKVGNPPSLKFSLENLTSSLIEKSKKAHLKGSISYKFVISPPYVELSKELRGRLLDALETSDSPFTVLRDPNEYSEDVKKRNASWLALGYDDKKRTKLLIEKRKNMKAEPTYILKANVSGWIHGDRNTRYTLSLEIYKEQLVVGPVATVLPTQDYEERVAKRKEAMLSLSPWFLMLWVISLVGLVGVWMRELWIVISAERDIRAHLKKCEFAAALEAAYSKQAELLLPLEWVNNQRDSIIRKVHIAKHVQNPNARLRGQIAQWDSIWRTEQTRLLQQEQAVGVGGRVIDVNNRQVSKLRLILSRILYSIAFRSIVLALALIFVGSMLFRFPSVSSLYLDSMPQVSVLFDVNGKTIAELSSKERRVLVKFRDIPVSLQHAVVASEDPAFFIHSGFSLRSYFRALADRVLDGRGSQGRTSITQQLAKMLCKRNRRTLFSNIQAFVLAFSLERNLSKSEILELYLNGAFFGHGANGVGAAATTYFNKEVSKLTPAQSALLAGLIQAPSRYTPFAHAEAAVERRETVLVKMKKLGFITENELSIALSEPIPTTGPNLPKTLAPYFSGYVGAELKRNNAYRLAQTDGLKIYTTLDLEMQFIAEKILESRLKKYAGTLIKRGNIKSPVHAALVVLDVKSGAIRVMAGSSSDPKSPFDMAALPKLGLGALLEPFVLLSAIREAGYTAATTVVDQPVAYYYDGKDWRLLEGSTSQASINSALQPMSSKDFAVWVPENYDNRFLGSIPLYKAVNRNAAIYPVLSKLGPSGVLDSAHAAGIESSLSVEAFFGRQASSFTLLELTNAISTLANGGIREEPYAILRVEDVAGGCIYSSNPVETEVFTAQISYVLGRLLKLSFSQNKRPTFGVLGESEDRRDAWNIYATPDLVFGLWLGYDKDFVESVKKAHHLTLLADSIYSEIDGKVYKNSPIRDFPVPEGIVFMEIDADTGKAASRTTAHKVLQAFVRGSEPSP